MPVFWFALSQLTWIDLPDTILVFIIFHVLIYPSSNGYNSYMDRDTGSVGGIEKPMEPTRQLYTVTLIMDGIALLAAFYISTYFVAGILAYILVSKAYSYRGIRLKKYPVTGYLLVMLFQGGVTFWLVYHGCSADKTLQVPVMLMVVASLLIGGFYPLTQIYQHEADRKDGVTSISYILGYRGTFIYCGIMYIAAFVLLARYFVYNLQSTSFYLFSVIMLPVLLYFFYWAGRVWKNPAYADFKHTMRMNTIAAICSNTAFIIIFLID
ncbi:MAG: UbiA prenyltransferase family protein [Chitinophagaceae bacterium]|nr:UbiA prenyltransferase family protein [Chitinophagaceae bacterium]MCW5929281.1 UbiA prenyltransferase family protein [Chitinophagaceae bacterium]